MQATSPSVGTKGVPMASIPTEITPPAAPRPGQAQKLRAAANDRVRAVADEGKTQVANSLSGLIDAAKEIAGRMEGNAAVAPYAGYLHRAAATLSSWSSTVNDKSVDDLAADTGALVRRRPGAAVAAAVAVGLVASSLLKSR